MSLEAFMKRFGGPDPVEAHNLRCEMVARAIKAIGDSYKVTHAAGECWHYPKVNSSGYGVTSVLHKTMVASRLVLCCATGKLYDYHNEAGEYMEAAHRSPVICQDHRCLNPEHLFWITKSDNCKRREADDLFKRGTAALASKLTEGTAKHG